MDEVAAYLLSLGQQVLQQQEGGEQPTVCFAVVPVVLPAAVIMAHAVRRHARRLRPRSA